MAVKINRDKKECVDLDFLEYIGNKNQEHLEIEDYLLELSERIKELSTEVKEVYKRLYKANRL